MNNQLPIEKVHNLYTLLIETSKLISKIRHNELSQYGIQLRQSEVLFSIKFIEANKEDATPIKISNLLLREPNTISRILTRMERKGLIYKIKNSFDGNRLKITLTEKGEQIYKKSSKIKSIREIMSCLSVEESQQLYSYLEKLFGNANLIYNKESKSILLFFNKNSI